MSLIDRLPEPDDEDDSSGNRRLLLLLVLLLVVLGAGFGSVALTSDEPDPAPQTPPVEQTPDSQANVSLGFPAGATLLRATDVVPGESGESDLVVRNTGDAAGRLAVSELTITDSENGIVGPESAVDNTSEAGELSENLLIHLRVRYAEGRTVDVYGTGDAFVPLAAIEASNQTFGDPIGPGEDATFVLDWRVDPAAGNEIQSDVTGFAFRLQLREPEATDE